MQVLNCIKLSDFESVKGKSLLQGKVREVFALAPPLALFDLKVFFSLFGMSVLINLGVFIKDVFPFDVFFC